MSLEDAFTAISKDARNLLGSKEEDMKIIGLRILKDQLEVKLKNVTEKPIDILKRIDKYVQYEKDIEEPPPLAAVAVKIIIFEEEWKLIAREEKEKADEEAERKRKLLNPVDEDEEEEDDEDEEDINKKVEEVVVKTLWDEFIEKDANLRPPESINLSKIEDKELIKGMILSPWRSFNETFRVSRHTEILPLKKIACDFWGIEDVTGWNLYDENGEKQEAA